MTYIVAVGHPFHAIDFYGTFDTQNQAEYWATRNVGQTGWFVEPIKNVAQVTQ